MLNTLSIRNVVLIDRLDVAFGPGLTVLSGETGAGKSIILDALGLALGMRSARSLVRAGADQASVTAVFSIAPDHPARPLLAAAGLEIDAGEDLVLRRLLGADGRSRAFVNDQPASVRLLRDLGAQLLEVFGQHDGHGLLNAATHRGLLDAYGALEDEVAALGRLWEAVKAAQAQLEEIEAHLHKAQEDSDLTRAALEELDRLEPQAGEEERLAAERAFLMQAQHVAQTVQSAYGVLEDERGPQAQVSSALALLEQALGGLQDGACPPAVAAPLDRTAQALERALIEIEEAVAALTEAGQALDVRPERLEQAEERLFALRAAARKHGVGVDDLVEVRAALLARLESMENLEEAHGQAQDALAQARVAYDKAASALAEKRAKAGVRLQKALAKELAPLKMQKAAFRVAQTMLPPERHGPQGMDQISFEVCTNPGTPFGPLGAIASGGELSRFSLAMKVALTGDKGHKVMVFDEIDQGVGGAVADAVGRRLAALARTAQVLVVTHSPQVAARASRQYRVEKLEQGNTIRTQLQALDEDERREEIARMLAGADVSDEARSAARALLEA